jgi:hypothetical protein
MLPQIMRVLCEVGKKVAENYRTAPSDDLPPSFLYKTAAVAPHALGAFQADHPEAVYAIDLHARMLRNDMPESAAVLAHNIRTMTQDNPGWIIVCFDFR